MKSPLTFLDGFPASIQGRQVPAFALSAHYPQTPSRRIER
jgi:hypothetical protein